MEDVADAIALEKTAFADAVIDLRAEMEVKIEKATEDCEEAIAGAEVDFEEEMKDNKEMVEGAAVDASGAVDELIAEARAKWELRHRYELLNAKFQQDSYYRFHLMKLVQLKDKAVQEALESLKV
jgi:hypothetical protein